MYEGDIFDYRLTMKYRTNDIYWLPEEKEILKIHSTKLAFFDLCA